MVHPYPGDIDYSEELVVQAPTEAAAGEALTATFVELVTRANTNPILEFDLLNVMPTPQRRVKGADYRWTRARILDPSQRAELARQLAGVDGGRLNSDWRILVRGGRYIVIGKIYGIHALSSITGEELFTTQWLGTQYQGIYFGEEVPPTFENVPLGEYASLMRFFALRYARGKYLKAAKRSFNYLRAIGDLEAMAEVARIFAGPAAKTSYQIVVLEAISMALDPAMSSRILLADDARNLLREAAAVMKVELPVMPGTNPGRPQWVADELHNIAAAIQSRTTEPVGIVEPNALLSEQMDTMLDFEIKPMIKLSLSDHIRSIINTYVR
jgi:hypothetical protein